MADEGSVPDQRRKQSPLPHQAQGLDRAQFHSEPHGYHSIEGMMSFVVIKVVVAMLTADLRELHAMFATHLEQQWHTILAL